MASPVTDLLPNLPAELERIDARLRDAVRTNDDYLTEVASHLIVAGGKRLRPAFSVAAAWCADGAEPEAPEAAVMGGVSVELVHLGSLYHDDVIDEATTRRTVESVNAKWGNFTAIVAGDFLLARASQIAASLGTEVAGLLAATIGRLCEGEVLELRATFNTGRTEQAYFESISGKTASLFAAACRIGGIVTSQPRDRIDALTEFGSAYGMAFQIVDDVLDVVATDDQLGKPAGHDLVEGVYTLPVLRALAAVDGDRLRDVLGRPLSESEKDHARSLVRANGAVPDALKTADSYVDQALDALEKVGPSPAADWLAATARSLTNVTALE